jgi:hypothetical protein
VAKMSNSILSLTLNLYPLLPTLIKDPRIRPTHAKPLKATYVLVIWHKKEGICTGQSWQ